MFYTGAKNWHEFRKVLSNRGLIFSFEQLVLSYLVVAAVASRTLLKRLTLNYIESYFTGLVTTIVNRGEWL